MAKVRRLRGPNFPDIKKRLRAMPIQAATEIAAEVAPELTAAVQRDYSAGRTVYGDPRPPHPRTGRVPDLVLTGRTQAQLRFRAIGTTTEARLTYPWVKYLIGWFKIMPIGSAALPTPWVKLIDGVAKRVLSKRTERIAA